MQILKLVSVKLFYMFCLWNHAKSLASLQVHMGFDSPSPLAVEQWRDTIAHPEKVVAEWHTPTAPWACPCHGHMDTPTYHHWASVRHTCKHYCALAKWWHFISTNGCIHFRDIFTSERNIKYFTSFRLYSERSERVGSISLYLIQLSN